MGARIDDDATGAATRVRRWRDAGERRLEVLRVRLPPVDTAVRILERDRDAAGTLLGSAMANRLFVFFVPLVLLSLGIAGLLGNHTEIDSVSSISDLRGQLAAEIDSAFDQSVTGAWVSLVVGVLGMAWSGRSLTRALVLSSALSWRLGGGQRTTLRVIGVVVGIFVGMALLWAIENRIRQSLGVAVASVSFVAVALVYVVLWATLLLVLPRGTSDPGAALPGAFVVGVAVAGLQAVGQLYVPGAIDDASQVFAVVGAALATLGWFFVIGRTLAFAFAVNAVVYERHGSLSGLVFGLPLLREIPRRSRAFAEFFDLPHGEGGSDPSG